MLSGPPLVTACEPNMVDPVFLELAAQDATTGCRSRWPVECWAPQSWRSTSGARVPSRNGLDWTGLTQDHRRLG